MATETDRLELISSMFLAIDAFAEMVDELFANVNEAHDAFVADENEATAIALSDARAELAAWKELCSTVGKHVNDKARKRYDALVDNQARKAEVLGEITYIKAPRADRKVKAKVETDSMAAFLKAIGKRTATAE